MQIDSPTSGQPATGLSAVPLFHAAWLFAVGVAVTQWLWFRPSFVLAAMGLIAVLCGVAALRAQRIVWLPLALLWCLLGTWCGLMEPQPAPTPALAALSDGLLRTVEGTVVDAGAVRGETEQNLNDDEPATAAPEQQPSQRIDLHVASLETVSDAEDAQTPIPGGVRLTVRWPHGAASQAAAQPFHCGDRIRATVRLLQPEVYHDPSVWSREDYLLGQGITSTASVNIEQVDRLAGSASAVTFLACRISGLQHATTARLMALPVAMRRLPAPLRLTQDDASMLAAMVAGDRTFLTHSLRTGFERTGSFHMLVVSGFHLAIVAAFIFWITRRLRMPRVPATFVTIAASFAYALFTGFATPVERSLWMITLYLLGRLVYRERSPLNTIGFASLCLLAVSPRSLFDAGLQMTLLAVVAIAGIAAPLLQGTVHPYLNATHDLRLIAIDAKLPPRLAQFRNLLRMAAAHMNDAGHRRIAWRIFPWTVRFCLRLVELLVVSCVVELAMTLPMAVYFHRITIFALPVNLLILPLLAILMPAALITILLLVTWTAAAVVPAMAVALVLHFSVGLVHLFGSLAFGDFRIPTPLLWQSAVFCALLAAAVVLAHLSVTTSSHWQRRLAWAALLLASIAAVAPRPIQHPANALLVEAIDVGQGDSLLLITPGGKTLLVDGGGFGGGPHQAPQDYDIGEEVVSPALWARGIRHLDAVALSHTHSDHMGGLPAVLRNFHPDELWVGNNPRFGAYNDLLDEAASLHVRVRSLRASEAFSFGRTQVGVLAPFANYQPGPTPSNNDSLVLRVAYGATSVLLEGDAEAPIEDAMLAEPGLQSTLLKVGHHGSITSTRPEFLARVAPQWAVISCGLRNRYGHPRQEVLDELQSDRVGTFRTDIDGASCFLLNGKTTAPDPACGWR
ncbi:MAG TPA: ComEC/Rec2 family competence protein [Terracidiphilus sp.]|nr:ComEC/Rec2 family competence protein [Terracidiphilus sp.]